MKRILAVSLSLLILVSSAWAGKAKVWHHGSAGPHEKAELKQTVLTADGSVRLGRQVRSIAGIEAEHVWAVVEDPAGNLIVATGNQGHIYRVRPDGRVQTVHRSEDGQVLSLVAAPNGTVYAGTGPRGQVLAISGDRDVKVVATIPDTYIWSLVTDPNGQDLYAGTGPDGRIYKITPDGKTSVFYATRQDHVLCLAFDPQGQLYAGTSKRGLIYRIDPQAKGFVVYDSPQAEVRSLLVCSNGVYAGTSSPSTRKVPGTTASRSDRVEVAQAEAVVPASLVKSETTNVENKDKPTAASTPPANPPASTSTNPAASAPSTPSSRENSVYRIGTEGAIREVFRDKTMVLSLLQQGGRLLIGTGGDGQLYETQLEGQERTELARLDHTQIHCLCQRKDGSIVLATGDPGKLYVLENKYALKGTITSEVLDGRSTSRWGSLRWKANCPPGTRITVATRSGNVAEPDETWSHWSAEQTDPEVATIASPAARFLQYRVTLSTEQEKTSPTLNSISLRYMTLNTAPDVTSIEVPDMDAVNLENPKKLKLRWSATDGNEDDLSYSLYYRKDGWKHWVELEADLDRREYEWDTTTTPAGVYQVKVVASDRPSNTAEEALQAERISSAFIVDHMPASVRIQVEKQEGNRATIGVQASDGLTRLVSASFSVDGRKWTSLFPADGLFDSKEEHFQFRTDALKPGTHVIVVRVMDAAGNSASSDLVFTVAE